MNSAKKIFILALTIHLSISFMCGGTRDQIQVGPLESRHLIQRSSTLNPLRLTFKYYNFDLGDSASNIAFNETLMNGVSQFFSNILKVYGFTSNLIIPGSNCLGIINIPSSDQTNGIPNTDIVIYISSEFNFFSNYVAYAGACYIDINNLDNVIAGAIMINNYYFSDLDYSLKQYVLLHEVTHLLGFSSNLYSYWKRPNGKPYDATTTVLYIRGKYRNLLTTPNVLARTRFAFHCQNLTGVELEDNGGSGSAGSHWEKRIFQTEYMTAQVTDNPIVSVVSLALFKDTGWYEVDLEKGTALEFGTEYGCDFFNKKCIENGRSNFPSLYCVPELRYGCDHFFNGKGYCDIQSYSYILPSENQYFSNPYQGGNYFSDYCPYFKSNSNGYCMSSNNSLISTIIGSDEVAGPKSRCFVSSLNVNTPLRSDNTACYEIANCTARGAFVKVGNNEVFCPFTGGVLKVPGYIGYLKCPKSKLLCKNFPCLDMCLGLGNCINGVCQCYSGYGGQNCAIKCDPSCSSCDNQACLICNDKTKTISGKVCI